MPRSRASANYDITARDRTRAGINSARNGLIGLDKAAQSLGLNYRLLGAAAVAGVGLIFASQARAIDQMGKFSSQTGLAVSSLQAFRAEGDLAGVSADAIDKAFEKMQLRVSRAAAGFGVAKDALIELGLDAKELESLNTDEKFYQIAEALDEVTGSGNRARLAADVFGQKQVALLNLNVDLVRENEAALKRTGLALTQLDTRGVEAMNDEFTKLSTRTDNIAKVFTASLAPAITVLTRNANDLTSDFSGARAGAEGIADGILFMSAVGGIALDKIRANAVGLRIAFEKATIVDDYFLSFISGSEDAQIEIEETQKRIALLEKQQDELKKNFSLEGVRSEFRKLKDEVEDFQNGLDTGITSNAGAGDALSGQFIRTARTGFDALERALLTGNEKIEQQYQAQLETIANYARAFPEEIERVASAELAAETARSTALEQFRKQEQAKREALTAPAQSGFDSVVASLRTEAENIEAEYANQLEAIDAFNRAFPSRIGEGLALQVRALEARDRALADFRSVEIEQPALADFDSLTAELRSESESIQAAFTERLVIVDNFNQAFPDRIAEGLALELRAREDRDNAIADYERNKADQLAQLRAPIDAGTEEGGELDALQRRTQAELQAIEDAHVEKLDLLNSLAANDASIAADQASIEIELYRDKEKAKNIIVADAARERAQIERTAALGLFNIAANGLGKLIKNEEKARDFQAGVSKARALMAGVEAAEKARAWGSTLGGPAGGAIAYGLSWAATLASVATIDQAKSGGGVGSGAAGSVSAGTDIGSSQEAVTSNLQQTNPINYNITLVHDDKLLNEDRLKEIAAESVAQSTQDGTLLQDVNDTSIYKYNAA